MPALKSLSNVTDGREPISSPQSQVQRHSHKGDSQAVGGGRPSSYLSPLLTPSLVPNRLAPSHSITNLDNPRYNATCLIRYNETSSPASTTCPLSRASPTSRMVESQSHPPSARYRGTATRATARPSGVAVPANAVAAPDKPPTAPPLFLKPRPNLGTSTLHAVLHSVFRGANPIDLSRESNPRQCVPPNSSAFLWHPSSSIDRRSTSIALSFRLFRRRSATPSPLPPEFSARDWPDTTICPKTSLRASTTLPLRRHSNTGRAAGEIPPVGRGVREDQSRSATKASGLGAASHRNDRMSAARASPGRKRLEKSRRATGEESGTEGERGRERAETNSARAEGRGREEEDAEEARAQTGRVSSSVIPSPRLSAASSVNSSRV
mmetsp:Transcript_26330/g.77845  ORF Transcript_26330/g.77845 Transcript_26330/m.77845 type:complete len:380 (+) Transcript_26330:171-1310(+)